MTSWTQYDENKTCATKVTLKRHTAEVDGAYWNCKAGANGWCKYVGAAIHHFKVYKMQVISYNFAKVLEFIMAPADMIVSIYYAEYHKYIALICLLWPF